MTAAAMLVLTTCASPEVAAKLASTLVEARLAACVSRIGNVASTYRWQGAVRADEEVLLLIKTTEERLSAVEAAILAETGYELPECLAVRVDHGTPAYLGWLADAVAE